MLRKVITLAAFSILTGVNVVSAQTYDTGNPTMNSRPAQPQSSPADSMQIVRGQCFQFAVPEGWQVGEEGAHAIVLFSPDRKALTIMSGNVNLLEGTDPAQFVQAKIAALGAQNLRISQPRQVQPMAGYMASFQFEYVYTVNNVPCHGLATCHVVTRYRACDMVMTAAATEETVWAAYANWLPQVATQFAPLNSTAFGTAAAQRQNVDISTKEGQQNKEYREYMARKQEEIVRDRERSQDRNNDEFRQALGNETRYDNDYTGREENQSSNNTVYWLNTVTGEVRGDANSSFDPRTPTDTNWTRMRPTQR